MYINGQRFVTRTKLVLRVTTTTSVNVLIGGDCKGKKYLILLIIPYRRERGREGVREGRRKEIRKTEGKEGRKEERKKGRKEGSSWDLCANQPNLLQTLPHVVHARYEYH